MELLRTYRSKLQASFFVLGLLAIAGAYWQASAGATAALRQTTHDRLTAIRETKRRLVEDYFTDVNNRVLALSTDESSIAALENFRDAWDSLPPVEPGTASYRNLLEYYRKSFAPMVAHQISESDVVEKWFPSEPRVRGLQHLFLSGNPHPVGNKDLLLQPAQSGEYGAVHARYHPTFHRYQDAFGLYDIFLIDAREGRILYSVFKEIDLGMRLSAPPYRNTTLARAFEKAMTRGAADRAVIQDYAPYIASHFAPAAFLAAPIRRAGINIGVLAIQVSIEHVNRVMTGDRHWESEGMGRTGSAYIVGGDSLLRSDLRFEIEEPEQFVEHMRKAGISREVIERIQRNGTGILNLPLPETITRAIVSDSQSPRIDLDFRGEEVIRSHARLNLPGLDWILVAEMETEEAFAPVSALRKRFLFTGLLVALAFLIAAWILARSVTRPVSVLAEGTRRLGGRDFGVRLPVESSDEIGHLAESFNRMAERLEQTTVSRDDLDRANQELEAMNARLIGAQEEERSRLARELHDDLTQRLAAVAIAAGTLKQIPESEVEKWRAGLTAIQRQLAEISDDIHGLSRRLHSRTLEELGLVAAIEGECRGFFERGGPPVDFTHSGNVDSLGGGEQLALYRIVQEALRNIFRHAGATEVGINVRLGEHDVILQVQDNGSGYDAGSPSWKPGLGLASMGERARLLGGSVVVDSRPGEGTRVTAKLPWERAE